MQLQTARQRKDEIPPVFLDRCSLPMKTAPKGENPFLQKFQYDKAERILLSTFIAGISGNPEQHVRFQMPATVDQAFQVAITVLEAEAQKKRSLAFFF